MVNLSEYEDKIKAGQQQALALPGVIRAMSGYIIINPAKRRERAKRT